MSGKAGPWLTAFGGVLQRDARIFISYRTLFASQTLSIVFNLIIFYYVSKLVRVESFPDPSAYFAFVTIGLVIVQVLTSTVGLGPTGARQELVAGTLERFIVSPFGTASGIVAILFFPVVQSLLAGVVTVAVATLIFGLPLNWGTAPLAIPVALLGSIAFVPFGVAFAAAVVAFKQALTGSQFIIAGMALVSGLYFPVELLPNGIEWLSEVQPFTPSADLLRHLLVDSELRDPAWASLIKLILFAVALLPVSFWLLNRAVLYGQRRGTIIEY